MNSQLTIAFCFTTLMENSWGPVSVNVANVDWELNWEGCWWGCGCGSVFFDNGWYWAWDGVTQIMDVPFSFMASITTTTGHTTGSYTLASLTALSAGSVPDWDGSVSSWRMRSSFGKVERARRSGVGRVKVWFRPAGRVYDFGVGVVFALVLYLVGWGG